MTGETNEDEAEAVRRLAAALAAIRSGEDEAEAVRLTAAAFGVSEREARWIIAIERGEGTGDVIVVPDDQADAPAEAGSET